MEPANVNQGVAEAADQEHPSDETVVSSLGYENEDPAGEPQSAADADSDVRYAKAALAYREAKAAFEEARRNLVIVVEDIGRDKDHLLAQSFRTPRPVYEIPLPMRFGEIAQYTGWTTQQVNDWLKYRLKTRVIKKKGHRGRYIYFYAERKPDARRERESIDRAFNSSSNAELAVPSERDVGADAVVLGDNRAGESSPGGEHHGGSGEAASGT